MIQRLAVLECVCTVHIIVKCDSAPLDFGRNHNKNVKYRISSVRYVSMFACALVYALYPYNEIPMCLLVARVLLKSSVQNVRMTTHKFSVGFCAQYSYTKNQ